MDVRVHIDSDQDDRAELARDLADIASVQRARAGAFEWVNLVVTGIGALPALMATMDAWARRHPGAKATVEADGEPLRIDAPEADREAWLERRRASQDLPPRRALLVASDRYEDPRLSELSAPASDVEALEAVLADAEVGGFHAERLVGAPSHAVCRRLERFFAGRDVEHDDVLLLYVAGHGVRSERGRFYFATENTDLSELRTTAVPGELVQELVRDSRAGTIILIFDCCHSGAFAEGLTARGDVEVHPEEVARGSGRVAMTASTALEFAFEADGGARKLGGARAGSLFTQSLVGGLRSGEADRNEDGWITVDELYDHICRELRQAGAPQAPGISTGTHSGIAIARSRRGASALPGWIGELVEHDEMEKRLAAVPPLQARAASKDPREAAAARAVLARLAEDDSARVGAAAQAALHSLRPPPEPHDPRLIAAGAAAALAVVAALVVLLLGGGDDPAVPYDFDGDGRQEIVMGVFETVDDPADARPGKVMIHAGPDAGGPHEVPPDFTVDEPLDDFGRGIASADFNGDGHADLALSTPNEQLVAVRYGSGKGLPDASDITIDGDQTDLAQGERLYGWNLVAADLDDDGYAELAIGAPDTPEGGAVQIFRGGPDGLDRRRPDRRVTLLAPPDVTSAFGARLRVGDLDGAGGLDLVEGAPDDEENGHLTTCRDVLAQQRCTVARRSGGTSSVAVADVDGDGFDDVVQGDTRDVAPTTPEGKAKTSGEVRVWRGGANGIAATAERIDERSLGQPAAPADEFGAGIDAADLDGEDGAEIVAGAPGAERVFTIRREDGAYRATILTSGAERDEDFGFGLALLDVTDAESLDLVVASADAVPRDAVRVIPDPASSPEPLPLPGLDAEIRVTARTLIALGRRAGP